MKILQAAVMTMALAQPFVQTAQAASSTDALISGAFASMPDTASQIAVLDTQEMSDTEGKLAPLALVAAIAGVDLALMGVFWGVYVPNYGGGGSCPSCSNSVFSHH